MAVLTVARLLPFEGEPRDPVPLEAGVRVFGRDPAVDVVLDHPLASRRHARIAARGDGTWIADLGSKNGTFVNGRRIEGERRLEDGDVIAIGGWKARFEAATGGGETVTFVIADGRRRREVTAHTLTIGRDSRCDVVVRDARVSRVQATIARRGTGFVLRDGGSTNGTFVGTARVVERELAAGDVIALGASPGAEDGLAPAALLRVAIDGDCLTLEVERAVASRGETGEVTIGFEVDVTRPIALAGVSREQAELDLVPILQAPVRGKAIRRGARWVPTADLAGHPVARALVLAAGGLSLAAGLWAVGRERADLLTPGPLRPAHRSQRFAAAALGEPGCAACHEAWSGVPGRSCTGCHAAASAVAGRHRELALACADCHPEHRAGLEADPAVGRHRCADCHPAAHVEPPPGGAGGKLFLNRPATSPRVHAGHRPLACRSCHAGPGDEESGRVTATCESCHGGARGPGDARCLTCHRYHERPASP